MTHRNLVVNAAQIAAVHGLDGDAVTLNHLPLYHPMHLNAAVYAGATQVLSPSPDPAAAIEAANRHGATHFYSLPVRLAHLAADPRLPGLRLDTVSAVFSGGSALLPAQARTLGAHFGIPVLQGYGLAETSPLTHGEPPARPGPGSVGPVVPGTDCRVVDVETRAPLPAGHNGEVQVRGPQLMRGYLGESAPAVDADGWFSTGDIGHQDEEAYLYLVDRIKDVFKYENWLVSPTEIEQVLITHPAVRDCAVVDHPEPFSGAVAHAFVVLDEAAGPPDPAELTAHVNDQVPYYQHIKYLDVVDRVPVPRTARYSAAHCAHALRTPTRRAGCTPARPTLLTPTRQETTRDHGDQPTHGPRRRRRLPEDPGRHHRAHEQSARLSQPLPLPFAQPPRGLRRDRPLGRRRVPPAGDEGHRVPGQGPRSRGPRHPEPDVFEILEEDAPRLG
ncbi:hypothetical protein SHKM778_47450 [Streptomyces sp. KM77-8]|uniref:Uncharacterized protein n=1 Tax=Streptomyces haneummycinicus TaxID=3074435 RepID=A0AAT9HLR6_9ACTN